MLDDLDRRILRHMQSEPEQSIPDLADRLGLTSSRLSRRLEKLREAGVILGHQAVIDWRALGVEQSFGLKLTSVRLWGKCQYRASRSRCAAPPNSGWRSRPSLARWMCACR